MSEGIRGREKKVSVISGCRASQLGNVEPGGACWTLGWQLHSGGHNPTGPTRAGAEHSDGAQSAPGHGESQRFPACSADAQD